MKTFVIDNYDSFTYNLVQLLDQVNANPTVVRNDRFKIEDLESFDKILISPGPGVPDDAGLTKAVIEKYGATKSILGICLGHQAIAEVFGGKISVMDKVYHGVATEIEVVDSSDYLFKNMPNKFDVGRYHSWLVDNDLPTELSVTAQDKNGQIMAIKHNAFDVRGVQFHPESILTEHGLQLIKNWITN
ncbi:MAG: aminodeoxychorismate/anthranilate synthase component II [Flavobacteriales bacterium]|nr:aminodeoxychorismate/anthranilate synthase component II [Flavobacteriales bacterium]